MKPLLVDLFCGAGGATRGYQQAGFRVLGVDHQPQSHYIGDEFTQADALHWLATTDLNALGVTAIHASPPCHDHSALASLTGKDATGWLVAATRDALMTCWGGAWVIENVPGAPLIAPITLCGSEFGLRAPDLDGTMVALKRHRLFEASTLLMGGGGCHCITARRRGRVRGVYGHGKNGAGSRGRTVGATVARRLMGIDWMNRDELAQAIPPAYTHHIGTQLIEQLASVAP